MAFNKILSRLRSRAGARPGERTTGGASLARSMLGRMRGAAPTPAPEKPVVPQMNDDRVQKFRSRFGRNAFMGRRSILG